MSNGITKDERLALLVAMSKRLSPALTDAKDEARADLMARFAEDGTDRRAIIVGDEKVGEVGVSYSKPAPFIYAERMADALDFLGAVGLTERVPAKGWEREFERVGGEVVHKETGEAVPWAGWQGKAPKAAAIRGCEPEDVLRAFGPRLYGPEVMALMEGRPE